MLQEYKKYYIKICKFSWRMFVEKVREQRRTIFRCCIVTTFFDRVLSHRAHFASEALIE